METISELITKIDCEELIWNDVSGCFDHSVQDFLNKNPKLSYVYSHSNVPERELTNQHMDFCFEEVSLPSVSFYFKEFLKQAKGFRNRFYLDPCFGFSKSLCKEKSKPSSLILFKFFST